MALTDFDPMSRSRIKTHIPSLSLPINAISNMKDRSDLVVGELSLEMVEISEALRLSQRAGTWPDLSTLFV